MRPTTAIRGAVLSSVTVNLGRPSSQFFVATAVVSIFNKIMTLILLFSICQILLPSFTSGQLDPSFYAPNYEHDLSTSKENEEFIFEDHGTPIENEKERRFMEGLVVEAGRHVLFPELYMADNEGQKRDIPKIHNYLSERNGMKIFEMKGQPEIEESYTNRQSRSRKFKCSDDCRIYKPVCGSDGKVYDSECHLLKENCGKDNVTVGEWSKCRGNHYLCPSRCLDLNEPVCGSDLRIYHNICLMRKKNCGKLIQKLPLAECYDRYRRIQDGECPDQCPPILKPACGSNGMIYFNECFLQMHTCREGIVQVDMASCVYIPKCPQVCLPLYDPVCGSDGNLYTNLCRMMQTNCGKEIKKMPSSFCSSEA